MRDIIHSLRGWPTPFGAALNVLQTSFQDPTSDSAQEALQACQTVAAEVVQFAKAWRTQA
jgi:FMN reductase